MKKYNKLVRDKIPEIIKSSGKKAVVQELDLGEYAQKLDEKLREEMNEYFDSSDNEIEELADLIEVVYAIAESKGCSINEFERIRREKREQRGGFESRLMLVESE